MIMISSRILAICTALLLTVEQPVVGQFGVPGNRRRPGTTFQEMQEMAQQEQQGGRGGGGGGGVDGGSTADEMLKYMTELMKDPEAMKQLEEMGTMTAEALDKMSKMTPEEVTAQFQPLLDMMTEPSVVDKVVEQRDDVLKALEQTGAVSADEIAKYKADPKYFEEQMRTSFGQMKDIFNNPEYMKKAVDYMSSLKDAMTTGDLNKLMGTDNLTDEQIEQVRQQFMKGDYSSNPAMQHMMNDPKTRDEMNEILADPIKWKNMVMQGVDMLRGGGGGGFDQLLGAKDQLTDEQIEEVRKQFLDGDYSSNPALAMFMEDPKQKEEMMSILEDPAKWKATVKEGIDMLTGGGGGGGLGGMMGGLGGMMAGAGGAGGVAGDGTAAADIEELLNKLKQEL